MSLEELNIQEYVISFLKEMNELYEFKDKTVMFMFYQPDIKNAQAVKSLGASKVYYVNPDEITTTEDEDIICLNSQPECFSTLKNDSVDLIIGLEILEHINNLKQFFSEIKRILAPDGKIELQGNPMWTSHFGHHLWIEDKFIFYDETNPFESWEHLIYRTKDEYLKALLNKNISQEDSEKIVSFIFDKLEVSRHSPTEIIEAASGIKNEPCKELNKASYSSAVVESYKVDDWRIIFKKYYDKTEPNEFFEKAKEFYSEEDLKTQRVVLRMRVDEDCELRCSGRQYVYEMPELPQHIADIIYPFVKKHDLKNKRVLNLCYNNNELISQAFMAQGAKLVYAVSPLIEHKQKTGPIKTFCQHFEDVNLWEFYRFDVVFFMDTLYNFKDFDKFLENLKQVVKDDTVMYIMGYMPYSSSAGHLIYTDEHRFSDETNVFESWEHLAYETREEFEAALKKKGLPDYEIEEISEIYHTPSKVLKYSPSELLKRFKEVKDLYLYRIYKYVPKNKYYEIAKKKYDEKDLDVERIIISTDFPEKLYFDELDIDTYLQDNIAEINRKYNLSGKKVLNLTPFINSILTNGIEAFGVKEVVAMTSHYSGFELESGLNARRINQGIEDLDNLDEKFDIIYGLDVLEHVKDVKKFFANLIRLVDDNGVICLQGSPLWPSDCGHNFMDGLDCGKLRMGSGNKCLEPWEHLAYNSKDELKEAMLKKKFTVHDAELVSDWIFNSEKINRMSFTDFLDVLDEFDNVFYGSKKILHYTEENEFYKIANKKYSHEELRTKELKLFIRKKLSDNTETKENTKTKAKKKTKETSQKIKKQSIVLRDNAEEQKIYKMPELPQHIEDILCPFFKKHDVKDKRVLNICYNDNELISQAFMAQGASCVYAVSPLLKEENKTGRIKTFRRNFEDVNLLEFYRFDVVFFMDTLYNFKDFDKFLENLKQVVADDTVMYIMGYMPYSSSAGHLIYTDEHRFSDETNVFESWEHLAYETREEFEAALKKKGLPDDEIEEISEIYHTPSKVLKYSPMELLEKFNQVKPLHLKRIYKYIPRNKYYEIAKKKYDEKDLDVERIIISTDFPEKLYFDELDIDTYLQNNLTEINRKYNLSGKKVLNLTPFINNILTNGIEAFGVKEVVAMTSHYSGFELESGLNARRINQGLEDLDNLDEKFDIIYGLDVLEHVKDLRKFYANLIRLVDDNGVICLQGSPLWPSDSGHNFMDELDCGKLRMGSGNKCLEPWEHLAYNSKDELKEAMLKKKFTVHDAELVSDWIFNSEKINRLSFTEFLNILDEFDNIFYGSKKILHYTEENEFYKIANQKYSHEELRTKELKLFIRKKLS